MRLPWQHLAHSSPVGYSNITTLLRKGSKREQNQSKSLCERTSCTCLSNNGRLKNLPWQSSAMVARCCFFAALHCMPDKERGPARIFQAQKPATTTVTEQTGWYADRWKGRLAEVSWTLPSWIWEYWWGRSPGRWNNSTDYEETVDPVSDDIDFEELSDFISGTELELCTQEEEQLISKDIAAYIAADRSPEVDVKILDGALVVQMLSPRTSNTFQDYRNSIFLPYIFGQLQSVRRLDIVRDVYLADSLKAGTRSKRGQGQRRKELPLAPLPSTWKTN